MGKTVNRKRKGLLLCLGLLLTWAAAPVVANPLRELQAAGHLEVTAKLTPEGEVVPGQRLSLTLKIATDRWFTGGTRISIPEVPALVILQTEQFATNASETRGDQTWVVQSWTLDVYPQRAGEFNIPGILMRLKVNAAEAGDIAGELESPPTRFSATIPAALAGIAQWVAAPEFSVSQQFDRDLNDLQVGDAFTRELRFTASDVMAMMLPEFEPQKVSGLAVYPSPPTLENNSNRGASSATRSQQISYVVEAQGHYQLPAQEYFWWETRSAKLQLLSLPAITFTVGDGVSVNTGEKPVIDGHILLRITAGLLLLATGGWLLHSYLSRGRGKRIAQWFTRTRTRLRQLRQPALPQQLNPGSNAGE